MTRPGRYPAEIRERAVRMVFEHERDHSSQWATISSIASKFGMTPETLRKWVPPGVATPPRSRFVWSVWFIDSCADRRRVGLERM